MFISLPLRFKLKRNSNSNIRCSDCLVLQRQKATTSSNVHDCIRKMIAFESISHRSLSVVLTIFCLLAIVAESFTLTTSNLNMRQMLSNSVFKQSDFIMNSSTRLMALKEGAYERISELREELLLLGNLRHLIAIHVLELVCDDFL